MHPTHGPLGRYTEAGLPMAGQSSELSSHALQTCPIVRQPAGHECQEHIEPFRFAASASCAVCSLTPYVLTRRKTAGGFMVHLVFEIDCAGRTVVLPLSWSDQSLH